MSALLTDRFAVTAAPSSLSSPTEGSVAIFTLESPSPVPALKNSKSLDRKVQGVSSSVVTVLPEGSEPFTRIISMASAPVSRQLWAEPVFRVFELLPTLHPALPPESSSVDLVRAVCASSPPPTTTTKYRMPGSSTVLEGAANRAMPSLTFAGPDRVATSLPSGFQRRRLTVGAAWGDSLAKRISTPVTV